MTPAQNLIKHLRKLPANGWLRRRTWARLIRSQRNRPNEIRIGSGGDIAHLPGGVMELRPALPVQQYPDMPAVRIQEDSSNGLRRWTLPPWYYRVGLEYRLATFAGQPQHGHWTYTLSADQVPVLIATVKVDLIESLPTIMWADADPPYWESAPAEDPDVNHPGLPPPEDDTPPTYPTDAYTIVAATVTSAFQGAPERVQILR